MAADQAKTNERALQQGTGWHVSELLRFVRSGTIDGHDEAGENLAGLYSLIATCEANGVNPVDYLADVLIRVQTHPDSRINELLPHNWSPPPRPEPSA